MSSEFQNEQIFDDDDIKIKRLRELFNQEHPKNDNHPKTSLGYKYSVSKYSNSYTDNNKYSRYNKAFSANRYSKYIYNNSNGLNGKIIYNFCKKHPGYLYYREIVTNLKNNKLNKKRTLTSRVVNRKLKLEDNFPNINYNRNNFISSQTYYNHHNYDYKNNTNDKNNPYSLFWANRILQKSDFRIKIKGMAYGVPKLASASKKDDFLRKVLNNNMSTRNQKYYNNFIRTSNQKNKNQKVTQNGIFAKNKKAKNNGKCYKIKANDKKLDKKEMKYNINDENNKAKILEDKDSPNKNNNDENEFENESYDEEQQKQFYTNQKNFFKARKDIMEEPEYLEEDNENSKHQ